jgi:hypothetical protein
MWGRMNMSPADILDVSGATYAYLVNGQPPAANWTGWEKSWTLLIFEWRQTSPDRKIGLP